MKQLIKIFATAIALAIAIATHAQEMVSFTPEDLVLLRQLACDENSDRPKLENPLAETEPSVSEILAVSSLDLSEEQIQSVYTEAVQIQSELQTEKSLQEFCADY